MVFMQRGPGAEQCRSRLTAWVSSWYLRLGRSPDQSFQAFKCEEGANRLWVGGGGVLSGLQGGRPSIVLFLWVSPQALPLSVLVGCGVGVG